MRLLSVIGAAAIIVALAVSCSRDASSPSAALPPNVVIYLVDTLRADRLGVYGYDRDTSPVLDRWSSEAVRFERGYSPTSWTKPASVSLLSGLDPLSHRVEDRLDVIPSEVLLLSERLKASGFHTAAAVTNPNVLPLWGFGRGFDVYEDLDSVRRGTRADAVVEHVTGWLPELAGKQPFFLYLHLLDPHDPYDPPAPFDAKFARSTRSPLGRAWAAYDGEIAFGDAQFGRFIDRLKRHGLYDNTLILFTSDHGEELRDHGRMGHGRTLFEEVIRVPFLIRFPGGAHAGKTVRAPVSLIDVVPTVLSVLGEPVPSHLDGRDLTALLDGEEPSWAGRDIYLSLDLAWSQDRSAVVRGVISGSRKYLRRVRPVPTEALFDIEADPRDTTNLSRDDRESRARLAARLDSYLAQRTSGIHLRILNEAGREPASGEAVLRTTGRFVDVSGSMLEDGDRFELHDEGRSLVLHFTLEDRRHPTGGVPPVVVDEDGLVFAVSPPDGSVVLEALRWRGGPELPLRVGPERRLASVPYTFSGAESGLVVRDVEQLLREFGRPPTRAPGGGYLAVVPAPEAHTEIPDGVRSRLQALGYLDE